jgi:hypothetical protein
MGNEIPVIVQEDLMKKKKKTPGYFVPAGILKILEIVSSNQSVILVSDQNIDELIETPLINY